jgi:hypothetical protein
VGLFDLFSRPSQEAPGLGRLERRLGVWLGTIAVGGQPAVPLELTGPRDGVPTPRLDLARALTSRYESLRTALQGALYEHYQPYLEAPDDDAVPAIGEASQIWDYVTIAHVRIQPMDGVETLEIGFETTWDVEHTPAARFQDWRLVEFNGSVQSVY